MYDNYCCFLIHVQSKRYCSRAILFLLREQPLAPEQLKNLRTQLYPGLQVQLYDPWVLLHTASALHLCVPVAYSLISSRNNYNCRYYNQADF